MIWLVEAFVSFSDLYVDRLRWCGYGAGVQYYFAILCIDRVSCSGDYDVGWSILCMLYFSLLLSGRDLMIADFLLANTDWLNDILGCSVMLWFVCLCISVTAIFYRCTALGLLMARGLLAFLVG